LIVRKVPRRSCQSMANIEREFDRSMHEIYRRAKAEAGYTASIFLNMLSDLGGLATAKQLINARTVSDGYTALWERARKRLRDYRFVPKSPSK
jgi:hypothetical protein